MARGKHTTADYWRDHFAAQSDSGLCTTDYIRQEGIRSSQWYYWVKKLRQTDNDGGATLIPITVQPSVLSRQTVFVQLPNGIAISLADVGSPAQLIQTLYRLGSI